MVDSYKQVSNIIIPKNRKQQVHDEIKNRQTDQDPPEYMNCPFNSKEFEEALKTLKDKKSPGPDKLPVRFWNQSKVQTPGNLQQQLDDRACSAELARS